MNQDNTCYWSGISGTNYKYYTYSLPTRFKIAQTGNYIYSRRDPSGLWVPIYIGQGDLGESIGFKHPQWACLRAHKTTHVHVHLHRDDQGRKLEENDLLENYTQAWFPKGCQQSPQSQLTKSRAPGIDIKTLQNL